MNVAYLTGDESPTAGLMNRLYAALDAKMTTLLGGRSFFLAQTATPPAYLCGKAFFFTSGLPVYATRVPGYIPVTSGGITVARPYNHAQFTAAATAATVQSYDDVNRVAVITKILPSAYAGLPLYDPGTQDWTIPNPPVYVQATVGFFEWSLAAHCVMHNGARYYLQDGWTATNATPIVPPERHLRFAVAEIIIEGPLAVTIEADWDKYSCFRIHNLNPKPATLTFAAGGYQVKLGPFQCATVRRDLTLVNGAWQAGNYRAGFNYFFKYEGGDPRFYWYHPMSGTPGGTTPVIHAGGRMSNSMQANNLSNAALLHDWVQFFQRTTDAVTVFCSWNDDATVQADVSPFYQGKFGDPANPATLLGDLLHHKGVIQIIRTSKGLVDGQHVVVNDSVTFNGYATIGADFAAKKLAVTENAQGNLVVSNADPENNVQLIPISTNLFKTGEAIPGTVTLPATIESAVFETEPAQAWLDSAGVDAQGSPLLAATAPQVVFQPAVTVTVPTQVWTDLFNNSQLNTVTGEPFTTLNWNNTYTSIQCTGVTILDGGGGYAEGDVLAAAGGEPEQVTRLTAVAVKNGLVTKLQISTPGLYPSGYSGLPHSPNALTGGSGNGCVVNLTFSNLVMNVQKVTVARLLSLDWWGDPTVPGQTSTWLAITNRKLQLTPQGLVLTFTETDTPLPGIDMMTENPTGLWATGQAGVSRQRSIRFRGHGWGFLGPVNGTEGTATVPPSAKTGFVSPNQPMKTIGSNYVGEAVAPDGADFTTKALTSNPQALKLLARVKARSLQVASELGRFWTAQLNQVAYGSEVAHDATLVMVLLAEMYNGMARAINACTQGIPLQWQALYFNVGGRIFNLDPASVNGSGPGAFSAGNLAADGSTTPYGYNGYGGPVPMNQLGAFDQGSLYEQLCGQLGIPIRTVADFPGGMGMVDGSFISQPFAWFQQRQSAPLVMDAAVAYAVENAVATKTGTAEVGGGGFLAPVGIFDVWEYTGTLAGIMEGLELLDTRKLLAGKVTGSRCLGTYNPAAFSAAFWDPVETNGAITGGYPDFTNQPPGSFYVAADGSGNLATAGLYNLDVGSRQVNAFGTTPGRGNAYVANSFYYEFTGNSWLNLSTQFVDYLWVQIQDIQAAVTAHGFPFLFMEAIMPLNLKYFADALVTQPAVEQMSATWEIYGTNLNNNMVDKIGALTASTTLLSGPSLLSTTLNNATTLGYGGGCYGTLIKFCPTASTAAEWKVGATPAPYPVDYGNNGALPPAQVCSISSRANASPLITVLSAPGPAAGDDGATLGLIFSGGPVPTDIGYSVTPVEVGLILSFTGYGPADMQQIVQLAPPAGLAWTAFTDLVAIPYSDSDFFDKTETLAFNIVSSQPFKPLPVVLSATGGWRMPTDWWNGITQAISVTDGRNNAAYEFVPAAQTQVQTVSAPGLTVMPLFPGARFWCCYSPAAWDLTAVSF